MKKILYLVLLSTISCKTPVLPHPTPVVTDTPLCVEAEKHLTDLCNNSGNYCCQVVAPTKKNKTFTQICIEKQNQGVFFNPRCLANVKSCDQIDKCTDSE